MHRGQTLEVITRRPASALHDVPMLFVHGAWHAAWCWDQGWLERFAARGWHVHALSLRGHGLSEGAERLRWTPVSDYVDDVARIAESLDRPPIVVGHSMGGFVVQKYLERFDAPGAVLLASIPPGGSKRFAGRVLRRQPFDFLQVFARRSLWPVVATPEDARHWFFSARLSDERVARHHAHLQDESFRAGLDFLLLDLPVPAKVRSPLLVLGAANDRIFPPDEVRATASAYGTRAEIFENMAHNMMLEPGWEAVADRIMAWAAAR